MSHASLSEADIIKTIETGFEDSLSIRLRCYKGYQMEKDLLTRLQKIYDRRVITNQELRAFDDIVKGHPDFLFDGYPADCKTVPLEEYLRDKVSRKIYWQMQAYMLYSRKDKALVIMEARDTGAIREYWLRPDANVMGEIDQKYKNVVAYWIEKKKGAIHA